LKELRGNYGICYFQDCLEGMRSIPDKSIDLCLTSPPFKDEDVPSDYWDWYDQLFQELIRICSKGIFIIQSSTRMNTIISKYPPKRTMIWGKGVSQYSFRFNPIFCYQLNEEYKINAHIWCDTFGIESVFGTWKVHKYQDPFVLYHTILKMFRDCKTIIEPFMGSGTTARCAEMLGMKWIGFEIDESYYDLIRKSIKIEDPNINKKQHTLQGVM
jgi:DNA modification methylase